MAAIDAVNAADPRRIPEGDSDIAQELLYAKRMTAWLLRVVKEPSEPLGLAVRAQHIARWMLPREQYPEGRIGYKRWRSDAAVMHAERVSNIMRDVGYSETETDRVKDLVLKKRLRTDPEAQALEDVACLVFLEHELDAFMQKHDDEKLIRIVQKTWLKMSPVGREHALRLTLSDRAREIVERATQSPVP